MFEPLAEEKKKKAKKAKKETFHSAHHAGMVQAPGDGSDKQKEKINLTRAFAGQRGEFIRSSYCLFLEIANKIAAMAG